MQILNKYYVYAFLRKDGSPYYIGKGCGNRVYEDRGRAIKKPPSDRIVFYHKNIEEEHALSLEKWYINLFGRKDIGTGILRNLTEGGDGISGYKHTTEAKIKICKARKGMIFSEEHKRKLSESRTGKKNHQYGKIRSEEYKKHNLKGKMPKTFLVKFPDNIILPIQNLSNFCKENGLSCGHLYETRTKRRNHTKGYSIIKEIKGETQCHSGEMQIPNRALVQ